MQLEDLPPYVQFEVRSIEDRNASIEAGCFIGKDVDYALITPAGSRDQVERVVDEWFTKLEEDVRQKRFKPEWLQSYRQQYQAWKAGQEIPVDGHPIKNWPVLSPGQVKTLTEIGIVTVEALAVANDTTLQAIGMGAQSLKQRAVEWVTSAKDVGKQSELIAALKATNQDLETRNKELTTTMQELITRMELLENAAKANQVVEAAEE